MSLSLTGVGLTHADGQQALINIDLQIDTGEHVAFIGPSGAGKTSLLRLLGTATRPTHGRLHVLDQTPWAISTAARQRLRKRIGLIHQAPPLPPRQRVVTAVGAGRLGYWSLLRGLANLAYPLDTEGVQRCLARLDMADKLYTRCDQLSGGQLQRVGIARVLYQAPALLLADEPVSAMDPVLADLTLQVLTQEARQRQATLVVSLHAVELALRHFPRIIGIRGGRLCFDRRAQDVTSADLDALYVNAQQPAPASRTGEDRLTWAPLRC